MSLSVRAASTLSPDTDDTRNEGPQVLPVSVSVASEIGIECLDSSQLLAISALFPKDRGRIFVTQLLDAAVIRHIDSPGVGPVDTAVITVKSIEAFARQHRQSKDTALRYIDVLEALQLLRRFRHAEYTELHIPLVAWAPSEQALSALDALLAADSARAKLQQLASGVKDRFLLLFGAPDSWSSLFLSLHETLADMQDLLDKRLSPTKRSLLKMRLTHLDARLLAAEGDWWVQQQEERHADLAEKGDFQQDTGNQLRASAAQKGDFPERTERAQASLAAQKGDFQLRGRNDSLPAHAEKGDFQHGPEEQPRASAAQKGDFQAAQLTRHAEKGDFQGSRAPHVAEKGDFQSSGPAPSLNDNGILNTIEITEIHGVNDNDAALAAPPYPSEDGYTRQQAATVGRQLALFLEGSPQNAGGFVNKCKQCTRTAIRAAVIDALVHSSFPTVDPADERGRPKSRAAWFHNACKDYMKTDAHIPSFVARWLKSELSWEEIERALQDARDRYARYMIGGSRTADLVRQWLRGELTTEALDEVLQLGEQQEYSPSHGPAQVSPARTEEATSRATGEKKSTGLVANQAHGKDWMDEYEAEVLAGQILQEAGLYGVTEAVARQDHGIYIVELVWNTYRMSMKNPQAWATHFEKVQRSLQVQQQYQREQAERKKGGNNGTAQ